MGCWLSSLVPRQLLQSSPQAPRAGPSGPEVGIFWDVSDGRDCILDACNHSMMRFYKRIGPAMINYTCSIHAGKLFDFHTHFATDLEIYHDVFYIGKLSFPRQL